jgi:hypothetical protein
MYVYFALFGQNNDLRVFVRVPVYVRVCSRARMHMRIYSIHAFIFIYTDCLSVTQHVYLCAYMFACYIHIYTHNRSASDNILHWQLAYTFLVDTQRRVRWRGVGYCLHHESKAMIECAQKLLEIK